MLHAGVCRGAAADVSHRHRQAGPAEIFVRIAESRGGSEDEQALAYFLPGLLYNSGYSVVLAVTCLIGWPLVGFMVGSVTGDPTAWHSSKQVVRLCTTLTWLLAVPCLLRVAVQAPVWFAGRSGGMDADTGQPLGACVKAALTATVEARKAGFDAPGAAQRVESIPQGVNAATSLARDDRALEAARARASAGPAISAARATASRSPSAAAVGQSKFRLSSKRFLSPPLEKGRSGRAAIRVGIAGEGNEGDPHPDPPPFRGREKKAPPPR